MNVVSLFDGMACGRVALERAGIPVTKYTASEIDPYAMRISGKNYPDIAQLGGVESVKYFSSYFSKADLLIGGSPCQGFSFAGKQLNFDDPRSSLFFEYIRILKLLRASNPDIKFLLENVLMRQEFRAVISSYLGVEPIEINSSLVSGQNRRRLYWTNIKGINQPDDKRIFLKDILETDGHGSIKNHGEYYSRPDKSMCIDANYFKGVDNHGQRTMIYMSPEQVKRAKITHSSKTWGSGNKMGTVPFPTSRNGKAKTLTASATIGSRAMNHIEECGYYRMLTPIECERLQGLPDNYTEGVSNTQRYKMIGNGWNIDTLAHIFSFLKP